MFHNDHKHLSSSSNILLYRCFGWIILGFVFSFFLNNVFVLSYQFPVYYQIFSELNWKSYTALGIYLSGLIIPILFVFSFPKTHLNLKQEFFTSLTFI